MKARGKRKQKGKEQTLAQVISSFIRSALCISEDEEAPAGRNEEDEEEELQEGGGQGNEEKDEKKKMMMMERQDLPCPEGDQHSLTTHVHHISSTVPGARKPDEEGDGMTKRTSFRWADEKCIDEEEDEGNPFVYLEEIEGHNKRSVASFFVSSSSYSPSDPRCCSSPPPPSAGYPSSSSSLRDSLANKRPSPSTQHPHIPSSPPSSSCACYPPSSEKKQAAKRSPGKRAERGGKSQRHPRKRRTKTSIPPSTLPTSSYPPPVNKDTSTSPSCSSSSSAVQTVLDTQHHLKLQRDTCVTSTFPLDLLPSSSSSSSSSFSSVDRPSTSTPGSHESVCCSSPPMPVLPSPASSSLSPSSSSDNDQFSFSSYPYFHWFLPSYLPCHQVTCESVEVSPTSFHPFFFFSSSASSCSPLLTPSGSLMSPTSSYSPPLLPSYLLASPAPSQLFSSLDVSSLPAPLPYPNAMHTHLSSSSTSSLTAVHPPPLSSPRRLPLLSTFSSSFSPYSPEETRSFLHPPSTRTNPVSSSYINLSERSSLDGSKPSFFTPTTTTTTAPEVTPVHHSEETSPSCSPLALSLPTYQDEDMVLTSASPSSSLSSKLWLPPSSYHPTSTRLEEEEDEALRTDGCQKDSLPSFETRLFTAEENVIPRKRSSLPPSNKELLSSSPCDISSPASRLPERTKPRLCLRPTKARGSTSTRSPGVPRREWRKKERRKAERSLGTARSYHYVRREEEADEDTRESCTGVKETRDLPRHEFFYRLKSETKGEEKRGTKNRADGWREEKRYMMRERSRNKKKSKKTIMMMLSTGERRGGDQEEEEERFGGEGKSCLDSRYAIGGEREKRREDISEIVETLEKTTRKEKVKESVRRESKTGKEGDERVEEEKEEGGGCERLLLHLLEDSSVDVVGPPHVKSEAAKEEEEEKKLARTEAVESLGKKGSFQTQEEAAQKKKRTEKRREKKLPPPAPPSRKVQDYQRQHRGAVPILRAAAYKEDKKEKEAEGRGGSLQSKKEAREEVVWGKAFQGDEAERTNAALRLPHHLHHRRNSSLDLLQREEKRDRETRRRRERRRGTTTTTTGEGGREAEEEAPEDMNDRRRRRRKRTSPLRSFSRKAREKEEEKDTRSAFHRGELRFLRRTVVQALSALRSQGGNKERSRACCSEDVVEEEKSLENTERLNKARTRENGEMGESGRAEQQQEDEEEEKGREKEKKITGRETSSKQNEMISKTAQTRDSVSSSSSLAFEKKETKRRRDERRCAHNSSSSLPPLSSPPENLKEGTPARMLFDPSFFQKPDGEEVVVVGGVKGDEEAWRGKRSSSFSSSSYVSPPPLWERNADGDSTGSYHSSYSSSPASSYSPPSSPYPSSPSSFSSSSRARDGSPSAESFFHYHLLHGPSSSAPLSPSIFSPSSSSSCSSPSGCSTSPSTRREQTCSSPLPASSSSFPFEGAGQLHPPHHHEGETPLYFSSSLPLQDFLPFQSPPPPPFSSSSFSSSFFVSSPSYPGSFPSLPSSCSSAQAPYPSVLCVSPSPLPPLPSPSLSNLHLWIESCKAFLTPGKSPGKKLSSSSSFSPSSTPLRCAFIPT